MTKDQVFGGERPAGFAFPVPDAIENMSPGECLRPFPGQETEISKRELARVLLAGIKAAYEQGVQPLLTLIRERKGGDVRQGDKSSDDLKTLADSESERIIGEHFAAAFGTDKFRMWGEESGASGETRSHIGIREDGVDGTQTMAYGKPSWGILAGVYEGTPESERQIIGVGYLPERNALFFRVEGAGVFLVDTTTGAITEQKPFPERDRIGEIMIHVWEDADVRARGTVREIQLALDKKGGVSRTSDSSIGDVLETLQTGGRRAMIFDTASGLEDLVAFSVIESLGYKLYNWNGEEIRADDLATAGPKLVIVPPGKAGAEILATVLEVARRAS